MNDSDKIKKNKLYALNEQSWEEKEQDEEFEKQLDEDKEQDETEDDND